MNNQMKSKPKQSTTSPGCQRKLRLGALLLSAAVLASSLPYLLPGFFHESAAAQDKDKPQISQTALRQIEALIQEKESRTPEQKKIDSQLLYKLKQDRGEQFAPGLEKLAITVQEEADGR
ncbi:MAG: hypothetical protein M3X11_17425, partial [Acidobacteriota bacterium]|nr:hypothetical protein [Acidobacteriota bacterium]